MPGKVGSLPNMSGCPTPNAQILGGSTCSMFAGRNHPQLTQSGDTNHHIHPHPTNPIAWFLLFPEFKENYHGKKRERNSTHTARLRCCDVEPPNYIKKVAATWEWIPCGWFYHPRKTPKILINSPFFAANSLGKQSCSMGPATWEKSCAGLKLEILKSRFSWLKYIKNRETRFEMESHWSNSWNDHYLTCQTFPNIDQ